MMNYAQPPRGMNYPQQSSGGRLSGAAQKVADAGRGDDSTLVHVSPAELRGLAAMSPIGRLPINPKTGLPEAGILSTILGIAGTIGGSFVGAPYLGPVLAGAVGGGLGTFGGSLLEGKSLGDSLGMGLMGGLMSYGMGSAAGMLGAAGAGDAAHQAAETMVQNGVTPADLSAMAPATAQSAVTSPYSFADLAGAGGGLGSSTANAAATSVDPYLSGALNSPSMAGVSQFGGAPQIVDPATGVSQSFSPTNQILTTSGNIAKGLTSPSALYDTFVNHAGSTLLPAAMGYYGMQAYDTPQTSGMPVAQTSDQQQMPTLPGPNQRKYTPPPPDWDYTTGKAWNYWTPAFAQGGPVKDAPNQFSGFAPRPMAQATDDADLTKRANELIEQIRQNYRPPQQGPVGIDDYARGGLVSSYGNSRGFGRPVTPRPMARMAMPKAVMAHAASPVARMAPPQMHQMLTRGMAGGGPVSGPGGGLDDAIPAVINGRQPAALSSGEYVVPAHAVSALGDGSSQAGSAKLDQMVNGVMQAKYGTRHPMPIHHMGHGLRGARPFPVTPTGVT